MTTHTRPETMPMCFSGDWTGIFIRGDNAFAYANALEDILKTCKDLLNPIDVVEMESLIKLLRSSTEGSEPNNKSPIQLMKKFEFCVDSILSEQD